MGRAWRLSPVAWVVTGLVACNGIVGIDDIYEGNRPGAGGDSGAGKGGSTSSAGKSGNSSEAGAAEGGRDAEGGTGTEPLGGAFAEPMGGAGSSGDNAGGAPSPTGGAVRGHVIDFWGHPLPNIPVQIGDTLVSTDKSGAFTVEDAPAVYDATLAYTFTSEFQVAAWAYLGLTRRDPTLQMYVGSARRDGELYVTFVPKPTLAANQRIDVAIGGPDGAETYDAVSASGTTEFPDWYGPAQTAETAHGLLWQTDAQKLPVKYLAYDSKSLPLNETTTANLTLDLTPSTITTGSIQGSVTPAGVGVRRNLVFLTFSSNARLELVRDAGADEFSYVAPSLPGASLTVAASEGSSYSGFAVAYLGGLAVGAKPALTIPTPLTPQTPASGTKNVTAATKFTFAGDTAGPYVAQFFSQDPDDPSAPASRYQTIYVVTAKKQFTLPTILGGGFALYPNRRYVWTVATHGPYASVDALAKEGGFLDSFSWDEETPQGPLRDAGQFTDSDVLEFSTAP
ncbi:MAG: hypothetical protein EOO73_23335 [Myxococcales bacterium]|nr:MAG: hypothetical protein EOO73_23335 [Myxococcales bacterium]